MSLVLVVAQGLVLAPLHQQLKALDMDVVSAADARSAHNALEVYQPNLVVCDELDVAVQLADAATRAPVVWACVEPPTIDDMQTALRAGLADRWQLPQSDESLYQLAVSAIDRKKKTLTQVERQLDQYVQDIQRDQRAGRYVQMGMLPPNPMAIDHYRFRHRVVPSLMLSGDFVDYFRLTDQHYVCYVADVSGHGASSAFVTVLLKNFSRRLRREYRPSMLTNPEEILQWVNKELLEQQIDKHVALFLGIGDLQANTFHYANAGHFPPAIYVSTEGAVFLEQQGKPLGLFEDVAYETATVELAVDDQLVLFSDGVLDQMPDGDLAQKEVKLLAAAGSLAVVPGADTQAIMANNAIDELWTRLELGGANTPGPDDMTCLTVARVA